ncbi:thioredoxin [Sulfurivirga caldicuralii]|uniref:Thioredoxin n=1 Tax=Sulfurivirga caldicuralii TaxID=364032 RepID=A0A1N6G904_9GAMM|nr:thioredoxin [Sulfurivirga caldicuralii]SIO04029.1 thioredoxin [Sulfurivirga caldicuralii]
MRQNEFIVNVNQANFNDVVIEGSKERPVLVDFWAPWCGPCRMVMPVLEKLAAEMAGQFVLAKVNIDEEQALAMQYGVRSVPTFKLFSNGEVVGELMGAQPEAAFKQLLEPHLSRPSDALRQQAWAAFSAAQVEQAIGLLKEAAAQDPNNTRIHLDLVNMLLKSGQIDAAAEIYNALPQAVRESERGKPLGLILKFARTAQSAGPREEVERKLAEDPNNVELKVALAAHKLLAQDYEGALQTFIEALTPDVNVMDGKVKELLLQVFDMLVAEEPELVKKYRRRLQMLMF